MWLSTKYLAWLLEWSYSLSYPHDHQWNKSVTFLTIYLYLCMHVSLCQVWKWHLFLSLTCPAPTGTKCVFGRCCPYPDRMGFHTLHVVSIMREGKPVSMVTIESYQAEEKGHDIMLHVFWQHSKGKESWIRAKRSTLWTKSQWEHRVFNYAEAISLVKITSYDSPYQLNLNVAGSTLSY